MLAEGSPLAVSLATTGDGSYADDGHAASPRPPTPTRARAASATPTDEPSMFARELRTPPCAVAPAPAVEARRPGLGGTPLQQRLFQQQQEQQEEQRRLLTAAEAAPQPLAAAARARTPSPVPASCDDHHYDHNDDDDHEDDLDRFCVAPQPTPLHSAVGPRGGDNLQFQPAARFAAADSPGDLAGLPLPSPDQPLLGVPRRPKGPARRPPTRCVVLGLWRAARARSMGKGIVLLLPPAHAPAVRGASGVATGSTWPMCAAPSCSTTRRRP